MRFLVDECTGPALARWLRERCPHRGVILLRLEDERAESKIAVIRRLLENHADRLADQFVVVTETAVRFAHR